MGGRRGKRSAPTGSPSATPEITSAPIKKQKREEYKAATGDEGTALPKKKWFRQRAHANPFSDHQLTYPLSPSSMDWSPYYPHFAAPAPGTPLRTQDESQAPHRSVPQVEIADIGCGFGGLLFALAPKMPETLMLGLEIRTSVTEFVQNKIRALRQQQLALNGQRGVTEAPAVPDLGTIEKGSEELAQTARETTSTMSSDPVAGGYRNIAALRANTMKFLPNFFGKASLSKIFLCFPDPHFKARKHKARIVSSTLTSEYAYVLKPGGKVYTITDVEDLALWMRDRFAASPQFEEVEEAERETDICVGVMREETEEGKKVTRHAGNKYVSVWRRKYDSPWPDEQA